MTRLTKMQVRILAAIDGDQSGVAAFTGERARSQGFGIFQAKHGGLIIRAYQSPQYFLKQRGFLEITERNTPGTWYRLTEAGRTAARQHL